MGLIKIKQYLLFLLICYDFNIPYGGLQVLPHPGNNLFEITNKSLNGFLFKKGSGVFKTDCQLINTFICQNGQIKFGNGIQTPLINHFPLPRRWQCFLLKTDRLLQHVLQRKHHIKDRIPAHISLYRYLFHQFFKRIILVLKSLKGLFFDLLHKGLYGFFG